MDIFTDMNLQIIMYVGEIGVVAITNYQTIIHTMVGVFIITTQNVMHKGDANLCWNQSKSKRCGEWDDASFLKIFLHSKVAQPPEGFRHYQQSAYVLQINK